MNGCCLPAANRGFSATLVRAFTLHSVVFLSYESLMETMTAGAPSHQHKVAHRSVSGSLRTSTWLGKST